MFVFEIVLILCVLASPLYGLDCEVSFRKRVWYPTGISPGIKNCSGSATTTTPSSLGANLSQIEFTNLLSSDVSTCVFSSATAASVGCGTIVATDTSCPDQVIEYIIKDCVGHASGEPLSDCWFTTIGSLAINGTFFFEAETTFADHMIDAHINRETELTACFCTEEICNKNETIVIIVPEKPSTEESESESDKGRSDVFVVPKFTLLLSGATYTLLSHG